MSLLTSIHSEPYSVTPNEGQPDSGAMTAAEVGRIIGNVDVDVARRHHVEMASVLAELAHDAAMDWPWTQDDPTVAVLRALAKLMMVAPDAVSESAWSLCQRLLVDGSDFTGTDGSVLESAS